MHGPDMYAEMSTLRVHREVQSASKADVAKMRSVLFYAIKYLRFSKNNQTVYNMRVTPKTAVSYRRRLETQGDKISMSLSPSLTFGLCFSSLLI